MSKTKTKQTFEEAWREDEDGPTQGQLDAIKKKQVADAAKTAEDAEFADSWKALKDE
jgi:hypothetical protein